MDFLKINGEFGEGGGQIVRSALCLSCITKKPIHLENIRAKREISGLRPQHLTSVSILQKISNAKTFGNKIGSTELRFAPGEVEESEITADVGTAGSIPLILQVLVPAISISQKKVELTIRGGTDVQWSPTTDYTRYVLREAYARMGIDFTMEVVKRGYFPKGGGEVKVKIHPGKIKPVIFSERKTRKVKVICTYSKMPSEKIHSQINEIRSELIKKKFTVKIEIRHEDALDSGASLLIYSIDENSIIGTDCIFDKKLQRFDLDLEEFMTNPSSVDKNLADMLVVPASLCKKKVTFQVMGISKHLETNLFVTSKITGCRYGIGKLPFGFEVIVNGV